MGWTQKILTGILRLIFVAGIATGLIGLGLGRRASRSPATQGIPDWIGFAGFGVAALMWVLVNVVIEGDDEEIPTEDELTRDTTTATTPAQESSGDPADVPEISEEELEDVRAELAADEELDEEFVDELLGMDASDGESGGTGQADASE